MSIGLPSCTVAVSSQCNSATSLTKHATDTATSTATNDIKVLANKVLQRNSVRNYGATPVLPMEVNIATQSLLSTSYGLSLNTLKNMAGDDWSWIACDKFLLEAFAKACAQNETMKHGVIPAHYAAKTHCQQCGEIPIPPELCNDGSVLGCPWCLIRNYTNRVTTH